MRGWLAGGLAHWLGRHLVAARPQVSPATSREAYVIMDALHTACNTKNAASLGKIEAWIAREKAEGKLGAGEEDAFARIIATARAGGWSEADREAVGFSQDQVGRGQLFDKEEGDARRSVGVEIAASRCPRATPLLGRLIEVEWVAYAQRRE